MPYRHGLCLFATQNHILSTSRHPTYPIRDNVTKGTTTAMPSLQVWSNLNIQCRQRVRTAPHLDTHFSSRAQPETPPMVGASLAVRTQSESTGPMLSAEFFVTRRILSPKVSRQRLAIHPADMIRIVHQSRSSLACLVRVTPCSAWRAGPCSNSIYPQAHFRRSSLATPRISQVRRVNGRSHHRRAPSF